MTDFERQTTLFTTVVDSIVTAIHPPVYASVFASAQQTPHTMQPQLRLRIPSRQTRHPEFGAPRIAARGAVFTDRGGRIKGLSASTQRNQKTGLTALFH